jgi:hypothetical protein
MTVYSAQPIQLFKDCPNFFRESHKLNIVYLDASILLNTTAYA